MGGGRGGDQRGRKMTPKEHTAAAAGVTEGELRKNRRVGTGGGGLVLVNLNDGLRAAVQRGAAVSYVSFSLSLTADDRTPSLLPTPPAAAGKKHWPCLCFP